MTIRPFSGQVLIKPVIETESNGVFFPESAFKQLQSVFEVVSVGKGKIKRFKNGKWIRLWAEMKVGQRVVCNTYAGKEVLVDGHLMRMVEHDSVMAVLTD